MRDFFSFRGFLVRFDFSYALRVATFLAVFIGLGVLQRDHTHIVNHTAFERGYASGRGAYTGQPITEQDLPDWTPIRVERRFDSGLTVVSSLGPHRNFQYLVRDMPPVFAEGAYFRRFNGTSFLIN